MDALVLEIPAQERTKLDTLLAEDAVSRQSVTIKDGRGVGLDRSAVILILEGDPKVLAHVREKASEFGGKVPAESASILQVHRDEADAAASGMGMIFGG
jgi:hypothetical protein